MNRIHLHVTIASMALASPFAYAFDLGAKLGAAVESVAKKQIDSSQGRSDSNSAGIPSAATRSTAPESAATTSELDISLFEVRGIKLTEARQSVEDKMAVMFPPEKMIKPTNPANSTTRFSNVTSYSSANCSKYGGGSGCIGGYQENVVTNGKVQLVRDENARVGFSEKGRLYHIELSSRTIGGANASECSASAQSILDKMVEKYGSPSLKTPRNARGGIDVSYQWGGGKGAAYFIIDAACSYETLNIKVSLSSKQIRLDDEAKAVKTDVRL